MQRSFRRQNPLLAEMLISLLFFAICACIIVCVFVSAYNNSERAASQQEALLYCQNIAEEFRAADKDFDEFFDALSWGRSGSDAITSEVFSNTEYQITAEPIDAGKYLRAFRIVALCGDEECFAFRVEVLTNE